MSVALVGLLKENAYYPFGMLNAQLSAPGITDPKNMYKYNDKELQKELNLEWLDYGARFYDPVIGRWHTPDPLCESYENLTPYNYVANCPISFIDPDGRYGKSVSTRYVDPTGKSIINTNDGRDDVFVVPWNRVAEFTKNANASQKTGASNSLGWNDFWRVQFSKVISENLLRQFHSESAKNAYIDYTFSGGFGDWVQFLYYELGGQWSDSELVLMGLANGINGVYFMNSLNAAKTGTYALVKTGI